MWGWLTNWRMQGISYSERFLSDRYFILEICLPKLEGAVELGL